MTDSAYPVQLELTIPEHFERSQVLLRVLVSAAIGLIHQSLFGVFGALYLLLPTVTAILISRHAGRGLLERDADRLRNLLEWVVGFYAYMLFVTDRFPLEREARPARLRIVSGPAPTMGDALLRLLLSLPHVVVLGLLAIVSCVVSLISAVCIVFALAIPQGLRNFQRDVVGWLARFFAYHASLVAAYPPFSLGGATTQTAKDTCQSA